MDKVKLFVISFFFILATMSLALLSISYTVNNNTVYLKRIVDECMFYDSNSTSNYFTDLNVKRCKYLISLYDPNNVGSIIKEIVECKSIDVTDGMLKLYDDNLIRAYVNGSYESVKKID